MSTSTFTTLDYCLFIAVLVISALIGVYYMLKERWRRTEATAEDILMGGREMGVFPVAMSLLASYMSAITVLGIPTEMYVYGVSYWLVAVAGWLTFPVTCFLFLPFFHNLQLSSAYEYLELRFSAWTRYIASALFVVQMLLYMAVVLYAPALALNQVTGLSLFGCILSVGVVVTFYTSVGGLRAVLWTDTFQTVVVVAGLLGVVIIGSHKVGGISKVWELSTEGGRTDFFNFDPSPFTRTTFWGVTMGSFIGQMTIYGASQTMLQRYMSIQNVRNSQMALFVSLPCTTVLVSLVCVAGLVIYATYRSCDPLLDGKLISRDQLLPFFVMDNLGDFKGVPGVFVSCIFAAALSSISSCLNALSITLLEDLIKPRMNKLTSVRWEAWLARGLGVACGLVIIGLAIVCSYIGNTVLQIMLTALGSGGGPLLGLFLLGMFFPCVNSYGALSGLIVSTFVTFWVAIGAFVKQVPQPTLPFSNEGCSAVINKTKLLRDPVYTIFEHLELATSVTPIPTLRPEISNAHVQNDVTGFDLVYRLSFLWYPTLAVIVCVIVGILVSAITGWTDGAGIDSRLIYPAHKHLCCCVSKRAKRWVNFASLWSYNINFMSEKQAKEFEADCINYIDTDEDSLFDSDDLEVVSESENASLLNTKEGNTDRKKEEEEGLDGRRNDGFEVELETKI